MLHEAVIFTNTSDRDRRCSGPFDRASFPNLARFRMELAQEGSGRRVDVTFRVTVPDSLKFRILKVNEAERYTLIAVEPDSPAASTEDTTVHEGQTDPVAALAELDPRKDAVRRRLLEDTLARLRGGGVDLQVDLSPRSRAVRTVNQSRQSAPGHPSRVSLHSVAAGSIMGAPGREWRELRGGDDEPSMSRCGVHRDRGGGPDANVRRCSVGGAAPDAG